ncbi:MAG: hypothetical protein JRI66_09200, partial [Deltaproteobacteria bacterium]|nr:hypothetical protein [Deltaproteobacteria bacterium]
GTDHTKLVGATVDLRGYYRTYPENALRIESLPAWNSTGATLGSGNALCANTGGTRVNEVRLPNQKNDPGYLGVNQAYLANGYGGYVRTMGPALCYVDADLGAVTRGDLLCVADESGNSSRWGALCKAGSGDTAVAKANASLSSGYSKIEVFLIPPRPVP